MNKSMYNSKLLLNVSGIYLNWVGIEGISKLYEEFV